MDAINWFVYASTYVSFIASLYFLFTWLEQPKKELKELKEWPLVTIAIPVYNGEKTLSRAVDSLLNLDYPKDKLQIMIVENNCSTDRTFSIAKQYESKGVEVYSISPEGSKARALNFALTKAKGEFFGCLDADSVAAPDSLKKIISTFDADTVAVTPALHTYRPKSFLGKVQQVEYLIGIFLRKVFDFLGVIYVTPGPFSFYRKSFFEHHGGYDEKNITEDLEIALRAQKARLKLKNAIDANVYAENPESFAALAKQRIRWYLGFLENILRYKTLLNPKKYGRLAFIIWLGFFSICFALTTIPISMFYLVKSLYNFLVLGKTLLTGAKLNFILNHFLNSKFSFSSIDIGPGMILAIPLISISFCMIFIAAKQSSRKAEGRLGISFILYLFSYTFLFSFWWYAVVWHKLFSKELYFGGVKWDNSLLNKIKKRLKCKPT
ncbi:MAG: glycosyltransferase [Candidatus Nanoarchaeia archaeon]